MKKIFIFILVLISINISAYCQESLTKVNLLLKMDDGKIGGQFFEDFVEADELEKGESKDDALARINKSLSFKLREGLHQKTDKLRFGDYADARYTLTVFFIKSNEDGQRASFNLQIKDNETGLTNTFSKSDGGGMFGSRLNLLGDCLIGVGKKSAKDIEKFIFSN